MLETVFVSGVFVEEIKNRFRCIVEIDGKENLCYIPSSCRLSNFLDMKGRKVLLLPIASKKAKMNYSVYAVKAGRRFIPVNLSNINAVVGDQLHKRCFSFLGKRKKFLREITIDGYKCDLFLPETNTVIEVKSILSFESVALFPCVKSDRAIRQLNTISNLLDKGYKVCYLLVSLSPYVQSININVVDSQFNSSFQECVIKGMKVYGVNVLMTGTEIKICKPLAINIPYEGV